MTGGGRAATPGEGVTVVVPTTGRASLARAIESALAQCDVSVEVRVVADLARATPSSLGIAHLAPSVQLHVTGGGRGGASARQLGTDRATTRWLAYLDDDDIWAPHKLAWQLAAARALAAPERAIVSCRALSRARANTAGVAVPRDLYTGGDVATYLFYRRRLSAARNMLQTSTLLLATGLAREVGWNCSLARHQDWDFVARATRAPHTRLVQLPDVLVELGVGSEGSLSASADWRASLDWALENENVWARHTFADFVAGQPLRYAVQRRSSRGVAASLAALARHRARPSSRAITLGLSGVLPRSGFERAMHVRGRRGPLSDGFASGPPAAHAEGAQAWSA